MLAEPFGVISALSVTTAASDLRLLSLAELQAATGEVSDVAALESLGLEVAAVISASCRVRHDGGSPPTLLRETISEVFRLSCAIPRLALSRYPVGAITSVTEGAAAVLAADYWIDYASGQLSRLSGDEPALWNQSKVTVVYTAGYVTPPERLKSAAKKLATALWAERGRDPSLKRVEIDGVGTREWWVSPSSDPLLTAEIRELLAPDMREVFV